MIPSQLRNILLDRTKDGPDAQEVKHRDGDDPDPIDEAVELAAKMKKGEPPKLPRKEELE